MRILQQGQRMHRFRVSVDQTYSSIISSGRFLKADSVGAVFSKHVFSSDADADGDADVKAIEASIVNGTALLTPA